MVPGSGPNLRTLLRTISLPLLAAAAAPVQAQVIHELAGPADSLERPSYLAIDDADRVYVASEARGVLKVTRADPDGQVAQVYSGPGIHFFGLPRSADFAVDAQGRMLLLDGNSSSVVSLGATGDRDVVIDSRGDLQGTPMTFPTALEVGPGGSVYVTDMQRVFVVDPQGTIRLLADVAGIQADTGVSVVGLEVLHVDASETVYVAGTESDNVFRLDASGAATLLLDATGDGAGNLLNMPIDVVTGVDGSVYVLGLASRNVFRLDPAGGVTELIDAQGDRGGLSNPRGIDVDRFGNVYVAGTFSDNVFKVSPRGEITELIGPAGDGAGITLDSPEDVCIDGRGRVYVIGWGSHNLLRLDATAGSLAHNGSGTNPAGFSERTQSILGATWDTHVDLTATGGSLSFQLVSFTPLAGVQLGIGELLCAPPYLQSDVVVGGSHSIALPLDLRLLGAELYAQGASVELGPLRVQLQNALELTLGTF